jgi:hypothetical protein
MPGGAICPVVSKVWPALYCEPDNWPLGAEEMAKDLLAAVMVDDTGKKVHIPGSAMGDGTRALLIEEDIG